MSNPAMFKKWEARNANRENSQDSSGSGSGGSMGQDRRQNFRYQRPRNYSNNNNSYNDFTNDTAGGRQYTSFDKPSTTGYHRPYRGVPQPLTPQIVDEIPEDLPTFSVKIDPTSVVCFNGREHWLSNLYRMNVNIDGHEYNSIEHYYQATKLFMLAGPEVADELSKVVEPSDVKAAARRLLRGKASNQQVENWKRTQAPAILVHALLQKFEQNDELRAKLLATENALLAHTFDRDNYYATGCKADAVKKWAGEHANQMLKIPFNAYMEESFKYIPNVCNGKNLLGVINMMVRNTLLGVQFDLDLDNESIASSVESPHLDIENLSIN